MPLLALDTSAAMSVAVLSDDGSLLGELTDESQRWHAERLAPLIHELFGSLGLQPADLTAIAVGTGPGPFTGLRIGLATAEALGFALGIPVYGVGSLEALAIGLAAELGLPADTEVVAVLDARRKEVYWAQYLVTGDAEPGKLVFEVTPPQVTAPSAVSIPSSSTIVAGDGAQKYGLAEPNAHLPRYPEAKWVGRIAQYRAAAGIPQPTVPLYLRRPDIQGQAPQPLPPGERG